jgi:hypothetical protein
MHLGRTIIITSVKQYQQRLARTKSIQNRGTRGLNHSTPAWFDQKRLATTISTTLNSLRAGRHPLHPAQPRAKPWHRSAKDGGCRRSSGGDSADGCHRSAGLPQTGGKAFDDGGARRREP